MNENHQMRQLFQVGVAVAFIALAFLGTTVIRIPIPASGGYFIALGADKIVAEFSGLPGVLGIDLGYAFANGWTYHNGRTQRVFACRDL